MTQYALQNLNVSKLQQDILTWYEENKRDLPWRKDQNPYKVWVSEIMLQQTKVDTVIPYFHKFMEKYPTVYDLAEADEQDVLKTWEGLGYYSRARNLQHAVREVVTEYGGKVPDTPKELGSLKGVGSYTKGAILSIAYNKPEPAVDGNVMRVFSRVLKVEEDIAKAKTKKLFEDLLYDIIPEEDPSSFNQAIMDIGATICTPKSPMCMFCPIQEHCQAFAEGIEEQLPVKSTMKKQKVMPYAALLIRNGNKVAIEKRPEDGLLANLWQFPMVPLTDFDITHVENWFYKHYGVRISLQEKKGDIKHVFSHIKWELQVYEAEFIEGEDERILWVEVEELDEYPFPVSHQKMMPYLQ